MRLKNTYTNSLETFEPLDPDRKQVLIYSCGPTVYSYAHIGNFRSFLFADVLRRALERQGYQVRHVMNITDVGHMTEDHLADAEGEDKLAKAARELGSDPYAVAAHYERAFAEDAAKLRLRCYAPDEAENPDLHPRATRHVAHMLEMIQALLERDYAYCDSAGQVYFDIGKFPEYGQLSGKNIDELEEGARVEVRSEKRDPRDFALWKVDSKHLMQWDPHSPAGWPDPADYELLEQLVPGGVDTRVKPGFPGWHIECSAMSRAHLGDRIDIHTGGEDNLFPHHECERAQSYGATGATVPAPAGAGDAGAERKSFSRYWLHGRHLLVDNRKMAKRDGTFFTVRDLLDPAGSGRADLVPRLEQAGFESGRVPPNVLRLALISNQYTQPVNFNFDLLAQARANIERLQSFRDRLKERAGPGEAGRVGALGQSATAGFDEALADNLNMPRALAELFGFVRECNQLELSPGEAAAALTVLGEFDHVLAVIEADAEAGQRSGLLTSERLEELLAAASARSQHVDQLMASSEPLQSADVEELLAMRAGARRAKDWPRADAIRDRLQAAGVSAEDTPAGVRWKLR